MRKRTRRLSWSILVGFVLCTPLAADPVERTLTLNPTERHYPLHTGSGDLDFGGNGPAVSLRAMLTPRAGCLYLDLAMHARETKADWTEALLSASGQQLWCAPPGVDILRILTPMGATGSYIDRDWEVDTIVPGLGEVDARLALPANASFIRTFIVMGDTNGDFDNNDNSGNDVGPGRAEGGRLVPTVYRTSVQVQFNPIRVLLSGPDPAPPAVTPGVSPGPRDIQLPGLATRFFIPPHTGGDGDFGGNGPNAQISVALRVVNGARLIADLTMTAQETRADWTAVRGTQSFLLWQAPFGWHIDSILSRSTSSVSYVDQDWDQDFLVDPAGEGAPTAAFRVVGDLDGGEAGSRTGAQAFFRPVTLRVSPLLPTLLRETDLHPTVLLDVPSGDFTNRMSGDNSCGPSAGSRVLRFYGVPTTYELFKRRVQSSGNFISDQSFGTPPGTLRDRMNDLFPGFVQDVLPLGDETKNEAAMNRIRALLEAGKPVLALIGWGSQNFLDVLSPHDAASTLHWVVIRGYDRATNTVYVIDNGHEVVWNRETFVSLFDYGQDFQFELLMASMNVQKGSIIYKR